MASTAKSKAASSKHPGGRPEFAPSKEQRAIVKQLAAFGVPHVNICEMVVGAGNPPIDVKTLKKHFAYELDNGLHEAVAKVAGSLFKNALDGNITAQIFYLKTRGGWRETPTALELSGKDGTPIATREVTKPEYEAALKRVLEAY